MPNHLRYVDENSQRIHQRLFARVKSLFLRTGNMTQTITLPHPCHKPVSIPHNIPLQGSDHFVGCQDALDTLHRELGRHDRVAISASVEVGGVGKTELAVQYAWKHLPDYPGGVCWLHARAGNLVAQVMTYVQHTLGLGIPQKYHTQLLTLTQQLQWCWQAWEPAGRVLLVLDDVTDLSACQPIFLAPPERFRIVLTTRKRCLDAGFFELSLDVLSPDAARTLLEALVGKERVHRERAMADALCQWLSYLPLGLELVGCYLAQSRRVSLVEMLDRLQDAAPSLEEASFTGCEPLMAAQRGVHAALELSWHTLDREARNVAQLLSLFAPVAVPWALTTRVMHQVQGDTSGICSARRQLENLHLVQPGAGGTEAGRLHSLIREFLQEKQAKSFSTQDDLKRALMQVIVAIAKGITPTPTRETIQAVLPIMPHLETVVEQYTAYLTDDELLWPCAGLGRVYAGQGLYTLAEPWYAVCLNKTQERFGQEHLDVATALNNLAGLYWVQGRYSEAEPLFRAALAMYQRLLGQEHPDVATGLNNVAGLYRAQGRYSEAEPLFREALAMRQHLLDQGHPDVAISLSNLAELYRAQGRYSEAEPLFREALAMRQHLLGQGHPDVAISLNNLALLYANQQQFEKAAPLLEQAVQIVRQMLGEKHPTTQLFKQNLQQLQAVSRGAAPPDNG